jgi:hypothetical protein
MEIVRKLFYMNEKLVGAKLYIRMKCILCAPYYSLCGLRVLRRFTKNAVNASESIRFISELFCIFNSQRKIGIFVMPITGMNVSIYGTGHNACLQHYISCMCTEFTRELSRMFLRSEFDSPIGMDD